MLAIHVTIFLIRAISYSLVVPNKFPNFRIKLGVLLVDKIRTCVHQLCRPSYHDVCAGGHGNTDQFFFGNLIDDQEKEKNYK